MNYNEIKKDFFKFPIDFDEMLFKKAMLKSIEESEEIIVLTNQLDIKNQNGSPININNLKQIIKASESKKRLEEEKGVYATEIDGNPERFLALALAFVLSGDAVILSVDVYNYGTVNLMAVLINTVLEELYGLSKMVSIFNASPAELKEALIGTDAILFCI